MPTFDNDTRFILAFSHQTLSLATDFFIFFSIHSPFILAQTIMRPNNLIIFAANSNQNFLSFSTEWRNSRPSPFFLSIIITLPKLMKVKNFEHEVKTRRKRFEPFSRYSLNSKRINNPSNKLHRKNRTIVSPKLFPSSRKSDYRYLCFDSFSMTNRFDRISKDRENVIANNERGSKGLIGSTIMKLELDGCSRLPLN